MRTKPKRWERRECQGNPAYYTYDKDCKRVPVGCVGRYRDPGADGHGGLNGGGWQSCDVCGGDGWLMVPIWN